MTGSNAKLCFALTYCPHHVVYALVYVSMCAPVCVRRIDWRPCVCLRVLRLCAFTVHVSGGGWWRCTNQSRTWRIRFTISKMPMFLKFTHTQARTRAYTPTHRHTRTITRPHTAYPACQRATWAAEACANRWEEPA